MRSAVYYPRTEVHSRPLMQSSLLLWDELHTIVPEHGYQPEYGGDAEMAEAWELIGRKLVPDARLKDLAHDAIAEVIRDGVPQNMWYLGQIDQPADPYEVYPQKLAIETLNMLQESKMAGAPLPNGDYPFTQEGGLLVMAKLADVCAGEQFARVTDRLMAYGMVGAGGGRLASDAEVVPITLDLIDASAIPLRRLLDLRKREAKERGGSDYTKFRHAYSDRIQSQITALSSARTLNDYQEINRKFREDMEIDLKDLRKDLGANKSDLFLKPVVVATVAAAASMLIDHSGASAAVLFGLGAVGGADPKEIAKAVGDFFDGGLSFGRKQREVMAEHPMAYMYALSSIRS
jgi:hypothetical protein